MTWSLYENDKFLKPLKFSNGKTQEDVVKEVLNAIQQGQKVIFIHGICGTGKSVIALNIARKLGKTSIIVPGKALQTQYKRDYENGKYLLKENGSKLKINVMTGRNNHECKFLSDNKSAIPTIKKEINLDLHDIFSGKRKEVMGMINGDMSADNPEIPCKIEIKEKNWNRIKKYLKQNKNININDFDSIQDVKRASVAFVCPYWSPVIPEEYGGNFSKSKKRSYSGLKDTKFFYYCQKPGCGFYEQFSSYLDSDVIIFNSLKYKLESALNRKPSTEVEIIDECDEFLDKFSDQRKINLDRLQNSLVRVVGDDKTYEIVDEMNVIIKQIKRDKRIMDGAENQNIFPIKHTGLYDLLKLLISSSEFFEEVDEESYLFECEETARMFEDFLEDTYITFEKKDDDKNLIANIVTINLAKRFKEMLDKNKIIVLMSGTLHSDNIIKNIFGIDNYKFIEAETQQQGNIEIVKTGMEMDCKYANFSSGKFTREDYLKALSKCVEVAKKPILIHINAFNDLPSKEEKEKFEIDNLITREKLRELQKEDSMGQIVDRFKKKEIDILFTTKCARGVDFPGEQCNSIVFTKYPNPNVQDAFWKILRQTKPEYYWDFYKDKAKREFWQKIYRGLRFKDDRVCLLSPDSRVLEVFEKK